MTYKNCQRYVSWLIGFARRMGGDCQGVGGLAIRSARRLVGDLKNCKVAGGWLIRSARRMVGDLQDLPGGCELAHKICQEDSG